MSQKRFSKVKRSHHLEPLRLYPTLSRRIAEIHRSTLQIRRATSWQKYHFFLSHVGQFFSVRKTRCFESAILLGSRRTNRPHWRRTGHGEILLHCKTITGFWLFMLILAGSCFGCCIGSGSALRFHLTQLRSVSVHFIMSALK